MSHAHEHMGVVGQKVPAAAAATDLPLLISGKGEFMNP